VKREARQNYYRQMHTAAREIYEAGQADERERIIKLLEHMPRTDNDRTIDAPLAIELIKVENK
jgi:hypothetical protein